MNNSLTQIAEGKLDTQVNICDTAEFAELSSHINDMARSLAAAQKKIEDERDLDKLTGLYNRGAMDRKLAELFSQPKSLGCSAVVMIDADQLKEINDRFGHKCGDEYIQAIADMMKDMGREDSIRARQGGDEFLLFLHGYETQETLMAEIDRLCRQQDQIDIQLPDGFTGKLKYSVGWCITGEGDRFPSLIKAADAMMYENKRKRKEAGVV